MEEKTTEIQENQKTIDERVAELETMITKLNRTRTEQQDNSGYVPPPTPTVIHLGKIQVSQKKRRAK